jgi:hypothetical protein
MRALADRRLPEPYRSWIDPAKALPPDIVLVPRTIDVGQDAITLVALTLPLGVVGAFFLMMASRIRPETDGWAPLVFLGLTGAALWIAPVLLVRRLVRTIGASAERKRGALRQGIFVGADGALVRMEPNSCHAIPPERFVSANLVQPLRPRASSKPTVVVETLDGKIELFADRLDGHPGRIVQAAKERWPAGKRPKSGKRKVRVDLTRTAWIQRAGWMFGGSIVAFVAGIAMLRIGGASRSDPSVQATVVGLLLLVAAAVLHVFFQFVRMRAFYRCPQCHTRPKRVLEAQPAIRYFCAACNVEWDAGRADPDYGD